MNIMLISQCNKNALKESRRILDHFAERRGERSWQTAITQQGLDTLHRMLRKTARRNTAVACFWIRGKDHSELAWIVGDSTRFNEQGGTPTNTTERDILRNTDENTWHHGEDIRLLAAIASLFHDFGKANKAFQDKLKPNNKKSKADIYRHEWISLRLFEAFVIQNNNNDETWLKCLCNLPKKWDWQQQLQRDGIDDNNRSIPLKSLPPFAQAVAWLIVSHHRLPTNPIWNDGLPKEPALQRAEKLIQANWCGAKKYQGDEYDKTAQRLFNKDLHDCWKFPKGIPFKSKHWQKHAANIAQSILKSPSLISTQWLDNAYVMQLSRMTLMLADHYYSSRDSLAYYGDKKYPLIANTDRETGKAKQRLDEHLIGVEVSASRIANSLPRLADSMPRIARHKGFKQRTTISKFRWQDRAFDLATGLQAQSEKHGFFGVNMASTGCGKTLANGRIMYALANPKKGTRFNIALGLRSLTLQTGDAYRQRLNLGSEDMAVLVGGGSVRALHEHQHSGSESADALLAEQDYVHYEGSLEDGPLNRWLNNDSNSKKLLNAPILVSTIDHLSPATEGTRGGRQIAPTLRLMTSDLILDEPDDFGLEDLPALSRLVHHAGLLGSRVLLSSATLPPALIQGLFQAYRQGREQFQKNQCEKDVELNICCAWFDEFNRQHNQHNQQEDFAQSHQQFVDKRLKKLRNATQRRKALISPLNIADNQSRGEICQQFAQQLLPQISQLHQQHHSVDPISKKQLSIGLIRMANIEPLIDVAKALFSLNAGKDEHIHLSVYHAKHPLLMRSALEARLDKLLNRAQENAIFDDKNIRQDLTQHPQQQQIYVVLATAVAEVGRDHDYDWAIVEPSSMRSIIQLAGRVKRHREQACKVANIHLLNSNIKHLENGLKEAAYCYPGFESKEFRLTSHVLDELLTPEQLERIDASSRIKQRGELKADANLVDLEHHSLQTLMLENHSRVEKIYPIDYWWNTRAMLTGELPRKQRFRNDKNGRQRYALVPNDDNEIDFKRFEKYSSPSTANNLLDQTQEISLGQGIRPWGQSSYKTALETLAESLQQDPIDCAWRFGIIDLPARNADRGWHYHSVLGFSKKRY